MKKHFITILLLAITCTASAQIPADSINAIIQREVAAKRSKNIIVGIIDSNGNRQVFAAGKISDNNPALPDVHTIYEIGSITKVFTSLLLADMSLKHVVDTNDPVSKYLPATIKAPSHNGKEITLVSLSTNRSGLPRNGYNVAPKDPDNPYATYTTKDLYEFISNYKLGYGINERWRYSNIGYALLGEALANAAGKDYKTLVEQGICKPLRMHSTFFSVPAKRKKTLAPGYAETGAPTGPWDFPVAGGGGLRSNVHDMLTFAAANLGITQSDLLPAMQMTHVLQARKNDDDVFTTMGWTLANNDGRYLVFKDGGTGGYRSFLGIDKINKTGVVVLCNANNGVTDIGWHILDSTHALQPYQYPWALLDTIRTTVRTKGIDAAIALYRQLKGPKQPSYTFTEAQLNHLGNELRRDKKIKEAIKIYELNIQEYPKSALVYESLAETYKLSSENRSAIEYFEKAQQADPENLHYGYMIRKLKAGNISK